jgi:hypothetical protein
MCSLEFVTLQRNCYQLNISTFRLRRCCTHPFWILKLSVVTSLEICISYWNVSMRNYNINNIKYFGLMTITGCRPRFGPGNRNYWSFVFYLMRVVRSITNCSHSGIFWQTFRGISTFIPGLINLLKPSGCFTYDQFNIKKFYVVHTLHLCVLYGSQNKEQLLPCKTLRDCFL